MCCAFDFQPDRRFQPGELPHARQINRFILRDDFKLHALFQAITRYVSLHRFSHFID